jgi:hypothetical protein
VLTFTDANPLATTADFTVAPGSTTISWGDGTTSAGAVSGPTGGPFTVSGSHTYSSTGNFNITTTVKDDGGSTTASTCKVLIFAAAPGGGSFVIGDKESAVGSAVTFWGAQWSKDNSMSGGTGPASFKGFAESPKSPSCTTPPSTWTGRTGNSSPPPDGPLPAFMAVIVSSSAAQSGSTDSGNIVSIVIVHTNPGYEPNPGHAGTGTVVLKFC